jgi:hypothetical protein
MAKHAMAAGVIMLVPTNAAMDAWLKAEQLSLDALIARKALAQRLVGYLVSFFSGRGYLVCSLPDPAHAPTSINPAHNAIAEPLPSSTQTDAAARRQAQGRQAGHPHRQP